MIILQRKRWFCRAILIFVEEISVFVEYRITPVILYTRIATSMDNQPGCFTENSLVITSSPLFIYKAHLLLK